MVACLVSSGDEPDLSAVVARPDVVVDVAPEAFTVGFIVGNHGGGVLLSRPCDAVHGVHSRVGRVTGVVECVIDMFSRIVDLLLDVIRCFVFHGFRLPVGLL